MKNVTKLISLVGTAAFALACGSSDKNTPTDTTKPDIIVPKVDTCADNPFLAGCPPVDNGTPSANPPPGNASPGPSVQAPPPPTGNGAEALARAAAQNILLTNCGQCHGPQGNNSAGMNYINDIDQLVKNNKVVPLDSANSLIIQKMRSGEMPLPPNALVSKSDIDQVAQFIDNPLFWPTAAPTSNCLTSNQSFDTDKLQRVVLNDLNSAANADDALNFRYISITNRFNAGVCNDTALDLDRQAMNKLVNMLSTDSKTRPPVAIEGGDNMVYRIDLRDYNMNVNVVVNGVNFKDAWEAIIAGNQYAVPYTGTQADQAVAASGTTVPVMFADSMLDAASFGFLYYGIIGIDAAQNVDDFILNVLGVDQAQDLLDRNELRAGTTKSRISRQDRLVQREDLGNNRAGALWQSFDFNAVANESIFADPFNFNEGGRELIFSQPNGLLAYAIVDANGAFQQDSDILLDTSQANFKAITSVSCSGCHSAGFQNVVDEVGPTSILNARALGFNNDQIQQLREIYVTPAVFAAQVADDSSLYTGALDRLKLPTAGSDPVSNLFIRFDRKVDLNSAAGDLGVTPVQLKQDLARLNPALQILGSGIGQDRDDFTQFYVDTLCQESTPLQNVPVQAVCDAAALAVANLNVNQ